jgi:hypothetical protein
MESSASLQWQRTDTNQAYRNLSAYQRALISIALPLRFEAAAAVRCISHDNRNQTLQFSSVQRLREFYVRFPTLTPLDGQIQLFRMYRTV